MASVPKNSLEGVHPDRKEEVRYSYVKGAVEKRFGGNGQHSVTTRARRLSAET